MDHHLCDPEYCSAILRDAIAYIYAPIVIWTDGFIVTGSWYSSMSFDGDLTGVPCYLGDAIAYTAIYVQVYLSMLV